MVVRIHFTTEDLARTQVAEGPDPLWEVLLSLHLLQNRDGPLVFNQWRERTRSQLSQLPAPPRGLATLAPPRGYSPDFLTPAESASGLEPGLEALHATSRSRLRTDLTRFTRTRRVPTWVRELDTASLGRIAEAVRVYHATAIAPYEPQIRSHLEADRSVRMRKMAHGGVEQLLTTLHPGLRWDPPVLEVRGMAAEGDVHLEGRGLRLIPSFFCWRAPIMLRDPALPPVLVYPVEHSPGWAEGRGRAKVRAGGENPCAALLGQTRAAALEVVASGCTTTELARRLNVSPATATHHTAILREAGLITSHRTGGAVHHMLRSLGAALLRGD